MSLSGIAMVIKGKQYLILPVQMYSFLEPYLQKVEADYWCSKLATSSGNITLQF